MMTVCKLLIATVYVYAISIPMQKAPMCFMIPYVYDLILVPFLPVADHMCMFIFVLYNQGTIMVQLPSFPSSDPFCLSVCPGTVCYGICNPLRDYSG